MKVEGLLVFSGNTEGVAKPGSQKAGQFLSYRAQISPLFTAGSDCVVPQLLTEHH